MPKTMIPNKDGGATVEIFEPRQHPEQEERVLDRFEMLPHEPPREYDLRSATAGFRYLPLGEETRRRLAEGDNPEAPSVGAGGIENPYGILPTEEIEAGQARQQEIEAQEDEGKGQRPRKADVEEASGKRARDEITTRKASEPKRGSREGHEGQPDVNGQPQPKGSEKSRTKS